MDIIGETFLTGTRSKEQSDSSNVSLKERISWINM
jgi:hypothetical protein